MVAKVALFAVFFNQIDPALLHDDIMEADYIGMPDGLHQSDLLYSSLYFVEGVDVTGVKFLGDVVLAYGVLHYASFLYHQPIMYYLYAPL